MRPKIARRYYLHQRIKKHFRYSSYNKTIIVPQDYQGNNVAVQELHSKFNYQIQFSIHD